MTADTKQAGGGSKRGDEPGGGKMPGVPTVTDSQTRIPLSRTATLMVVDDEPQIGNTLRLLLQPECDVSPMTSARAALARLASGDRFDVILCDLMMPEMSGMEFHEKLFRIAPDQAAAIVFMTGGVYTAASREFLDHTTNRCIEKPFDMAQLRALIAGRVG